MHMLYEIIPVFLFFIVFKWQGIYAATVVAIISSFLQVMITRLWQKKWDKRQVITLLAFLVFGGMTLYFHNPIFVKWKPTVVFWIFALIFFGSYFIGEKTCVERLTEGLLEDAMPVPVQTWVWLNSLWIFFFIAIGVINLYIAYQYSNDTWVNFKFYGITSAFFVMSIIQALFLYRYLRETKHE